MERETMCIMETVTVSIAWRLPGAAVTQSTQKSPGSGASLSLMRQAAQGFLVQTHEALPSRMFTDPHTDVGHSGKTLSMHCSALCLARTMLVFRWTGLWGQFWTSGAKDYSPVTSWYPAAPPSEAAPSSLAWPPSRLMTSLTSTCTYHLAAVSSSNLSCPPTPSTQNLHITCLTWQLY